MAVTNVTGVQDQEPSCAKFLQQQQRLIYLGMVYTHRKTMNAQMMEITTAPQRGVP